MDAPHESAAEAQLTIVPDIDVPQRLTQRVMTIHYSAEPIRSVLSRRTGIVTMLHRARRYPSGWLVLAAAIAVGSCKSGQGSDTPVLLGINITGAGTGTGTVTSAAAGISCTIDNGVATGSCYTQLRRGTAITLTATAAGTDQFAEWTGGCSGTTPTCQLKLTATTNVQATFSGMPTALTVALSGTGTGGVTSAPSGISCTRDAGTTAGSCVASFSAGTSVTLTAAPGGQSLFGTWMGDCSGSTANCTVVMSTPRSVSATMLLARTITVAGGGAGGGTVSSAPPGINCTVAAGTAAGQCAATFGDGTMVQLTATPDATSAFGSWSGACSGSTNPCDLTVAATGGVQATFVPLRTLTVSGAGLGAGTVTSVPAGINCSIGAGAASGTCIKTFPDATSVTLGATPGAGSGFTGWSGDCTGASCVLALTANRNAVASFNGASSAATTTVTLSAASIVAGDSSTVTITVKDASGNPVQGASVVLSVASGSPAVITQPVGTTAANGVISGRVTATVAGVRTIAATIDGTVTAAERPTLTVTAAAAHSIAQSGGFVTTGARFGQNVPSLPAVIVTDAYGNPIAGASVIFTLTKGHGTIGAGASSGTTLAVPTTSTGVAALSLWSLASVTSVGNYDKDIDVHNTVTADVTGLIGSPIEFTTAVTVSYATDVQAIWNYGIPAIAACTASGCHASGGSAPVLAGASRANLNGVYITPGDSINFSNSANRLLYRLINGAPVMPSGHPLPPNVVGIVKAYITQGAPSN